MTFKKLLALFDYLFMPKKLYIGIGGAILGGSVISGLLGSKAAGKEAGAIDRGTAEGRRQFDLEWGAKAPYREAGEAGLGRAEGMMTGSPEEVQAMMAQDPSYNWRFGQGERGVQNYLSGSGQRLGGSALRALTEYGQGMGSQEYGNVFNRNMALAGFGPSATQTPQNQIPQMMAARGGAEAGKYSAYNQAIQGGIQNYLSYDAQQQFGGGQFGGGGRSFLNPDSSTWG